MKKTRLIIISIFCLLITTHVSAKDLLDLYNGIINNDFYKATQVQSQAQHSITKEARANFLPHITAAANYGYANIGLNIDDTSAFASIFPGSLPQNFNTSGTFDSYGISVKQNIIDFQHLFDIKASKLLTQAKQINTEIVKQERTFLLLKTYFSVLAANDKIQFLQLEKKELQHIRNTVADKYRRGIVTKLQVYQADTSLQAVQVKILEAKAELSHRVNLLQLITDIRISRIQDVNTNRATTFLRRKPQSYWLKESTDKNLSLHKARLELYAMRKSIAAQKAQAYPTVYASGSYANFKGPAPIVNSANGNVSMVAIGVKVPIFTGGYISAKAGKLEHDYMSNKYKYQYAIAELGNNVKQVYDDLKTMQSKLVVDQQASKTTKNSLGTAKGAKQHGLDTLNTVLTQEKNYYQARMTYKKDIYDAILLKEKLSQLSGMLDRSSIQKISAILSEKDINLSAI